MQFKAGYLICFLAGGIAAGMDEYYDKPLPGRVEVRETQEVRSKPVAAAAQITQNARREEGKWEDVWGNVGKIYSGYVPNAESIGSVWASKGKELASSAHSDIVDAWGWGATATKTRDATKTSESSSSCNSADADGSASNLRGEIFGMVQTAIVAFTIFCYLV